MIGNVSNKKDITDEAPVSASSELDSSSDDNGAKLNSENYDINGIEIGNHGDNDNNVGNPNSYVSGDVLKSMSKLGKSHRGSVSVSRNRSASVGGSVGVSRNKCASVGGSVGVSHNESDNMTNKSSKPISNHDNYREAISRLGVGFDGFVREHPEFLDFLKQNPEIAKHMSEDYHFAKKLCITMILKIVY